MVYQLVSERMIKMSKILININNFNEIEEYKKIGITNFLFAVNDLSIGYNSFDIKDIPEDGYLLINRVLDNNGIDLLKNIVSEIKKHKGVIFEDVGVYQVLKELDIELIWFQNHFGTNYNSINEWNKLVTSCVISNEITSEEISTIVDKSIKQVCINILGRNQIMYSRRTLLSNFNKYNKLDNVNDVTLNTHNNPMKFIVRESKYGTIFLSNEYHNYIDFVNTLNQDKIKFKIILNDDLSVDKINSILNGGYFGNTGFLNQKTVYRLDDYKDKK